MNTNEANNISVPTPDGQLLLPLDNGLRTKAYWLTADAGFNLANGRNIENAAQIMQDAQQWNALVPGDVRTNDLALTDYLTKYYGTYYGGVPRSQGAITTTHKIATINVVPGVRRFVAGYTSGEGQATIFSGVLGGSFHLTDRLRADLGVRYEYNDFVQTAQNTAVTPVGGDVLNSRILYDQDVWGTSSYRHFGRSISDWAASAELNYALSGQTSVYALGSRAYKMPALDEFLNLTAAQQVGLLGSKRNWTGEVGVKHAARDFGVTLDGFFTVLKNIVSPGLVTDPSTGQPIWIVQANPEVRSYGLELEASGRLPNSGLRAVTNWTVLRAEYATCPAGPAGCPTGADVGTLLSGVPPFVGNVAITYGARSDLSLDADWHFVDRRCTSAVGCSNKLPTYSYINLGAQYVIPASGITIRAALLNPYQSIGLEEGNPRLSLVGGLTSNLFLARPILPRAFQLSVGYKF